MFVMGLLKSSLGSRRCSLPKISEIRRSQACVSTCVLPSPGITLVSQGCGGDAAVLRGAWHVVCAQCTLTNY